MSSKKHLMLLGAGAAVGALAVVAWAISGGSPADVLADARALSEAAIGWLKGLGPAGYYAGMTALATFGVPVSVLIIAGGAAFGKGWGIAGGLGALVGSAVIAHLLSRHVFEHPLRRLLAAVGRGIPKVPDGAHRVFALVMRITPGMPFVVQNYVLALGGVPLRINLGCLVPIQILYVSGFVLLGDAFTKGHFGKALFGVALLAAAAAVVHFLRKRNASRLQTEPGS